MDRSRSNFVKNRLRLAKFDRSPAEIDRIRPPSIGRFRAKLARRPNRFDVATSAPLWAGTLIDQRSGSALLGTHRMRGSGASGGGGGGGGREGERSAPTQRPSGDREATERCGRCLGGARVEPQRRPSSPRGLPERHVNGATLERARKWSDHKDLHGYQESPKARRIGGPVGATQDCGLGMGRVSVTCLRPPPQTSPQDKRARGQCHQGRRLRGGGNRGPLVCACGVCTGGSLQVPDL